MQVWMVGRVCREKQKQGQKFYIYSAITESQNPLTDKFPTWGIVDLFRANSQGDYLLCKISIYPICTKKTAE